MTNHPKDAHISDSASSGTEETMASEIRLFRKKPVVIEAEQWDGSVTSGHGIYDWIKGNGGRARFGEKGLQIGTLETPADEWFTVSPNDYVIRGIKGEFYACKPDIFAATYDAAENSEQAHETSDGPTKPTEPTLTCSEVVERLAKRICPECKSVNGYGTWWKCLNEFHRKQREAPNYPLCVRCRHEVNQEGLCEVCQAI